MISFSRITKLGALAGCSLALLAACDTPEKSEKSGLAFIPPSTGYEAASVKSSLSPTEAAAAFRKAGFQDVALINGGRTVRVRTNTDAMVDCGTIVQHAFGNRAEFPGSSNVAALISARSDGALILRKVKVSSTTEMTSNASGSFDVSEKHKATVEYHTPQGRRFSRDRAEFDESGVGQFGDKTSCRSAGIAQSIL